MSNYSDIVYSLFGGPVTSLTARSQTRKRPVQQRARETRERVLTAAAHIFSVHGYSAGTTNRIAQEASMSIGSLYQYFPNKDAILVELTHRHMADGRTRLTELLTRGLPERLDQLIAASVETMIELHIPDRDLHRVLFEEAPRSASIRAELKVIEDALVTQVAQVLTMYRETREMKDPELTARVVVVAIESVVHRFVAAADAPDPQALGEELTRLTMAYLTAA